MVTDREFVMANKYESTKKDKVADKRKGVKEGGKKDNAIDAKGMKKRGK
jgi:hypothetical protein